MGKSETSLGVKIADKTNDRPSTVKRQAVFSYPRKQPTTLAECNAELELAQKQLRQYQNREKVLTRKLFVEERRIRTHRLCARGGYLESIVPELIAMTDEEAKDYLYHAVHSEEAKAFLKKRAEGGVTE